jgi:hypothetical protein
VVVVLLLLLLLLLLLVVVLLLLLLVVVVVLLLLLLVVVVLLLLLLASLFSCKTLPNTLPQRDLLGRLRKKSGASTALFTPLPSHTMPPSPPPPDFPEDQC